MPVYETKRDRVRQRAVAQAVVVDGWGYSWAVTPQKLMLPYDGIATRACRDDIVVEIKVRDVPVDRYRKMFFSLRKAKDLMRVAEERSAIAAIVWAFNDGECRSMRVNQSFLSYPVETTGRTDRGVAKADIEPCLLIPVADMKVQPRWIKALEDA